MRPPNADADTTVMLLPGEGTIVGRGDKIFDPYLLPYSSKIFRAEVMSYNLMSYPAVSSCLLLSHILRQQ